MEDKKVLLTGGNLLQAHTWKGLLETHTITVELKGEALLGGVGELPVDMQNVELWVNKRDLTQAQSILETHNVERPQWTCVQCHEINHGNFEFCWQCSAQKSE
ncbi:DUF2007 domain-containing protein [Shewanella intestini]|uniref:DUF2007 domain-containing protein n=1 Tax=Shewanella intestini TaxID=2017544 RepID=A0ABS5I189_9GAMM|nr:MULTISPECIES: DUF2007 domain-containing protein [Shewanella]MBR9727454.1 DUF2007 domain-containing protein [Shewanella intestini]MRG35496.1 DUF2007 domain-containing protein [Shewanella sp. XMDDZSB0408]